MTPLSRRRLLKLALLIAGLACGFAASAGADLPALPTVTLPTVTLPTVTLPPVAPPPPAVPVPPLPPPPVHVPPPPHLPPPPHAPPPPAGTPSLPVGPPSGGGGATGGRSGSSGAGSSRGSAGALGTGAPAGSAPASARHARTAQLYRLRLSRDWISKRGSKRERHTTIVFVLRNPSLVQFVVLRVSPDCHRVGRFRVVGRQGVNRVRIGPRVGRHRLRRGTYRLVARAVPGGRRVVDAHLVVARSATRGEIEAARGDDTCTPSAQAFRSAIGGAGAASGTGGSTDGFSASKTAASSKTNAATRTKPAKHQGVLGAHFARKAVDAASEVPLWLYALLALAIVLLAAAALPLRAAPSTGTASVLARHRGVLALAGAGTLIVVMAVYVLL